MGLDMYLEANIKREDPDPRAREVFRIIDEEFPGEIPSGEFDNQGELSLVDFSFDKRMQDPRIQRVRAAIFAAFPVLHAENHWIGAKISKGQITLPLCYWRKANHIHAWFVRETAGGVDECEPSKVSREKLFELRKVVKRVEQDHSLAETLLPTQAGFFFGGTEYDEWYFEGLKHTRKMLDHICEKGLTEEAVITYCASW